MQDEADFLAAYDPSKYEPVAVSVDTVALTLRDGVLNVLAIKRARPPFRGHWALPGTFLKPDQTLDMAAVAGINAKANVIPRHMEQLNTFGDVDRDPRMRVVSVAYLAFGPTAGEPKAGFHTDEVSWLPIFGAAYRWAFDHGRMIEAGVKRAQDKLEYTALATSFLPKEFTMSDLRSVYEAIWDKGLEPANFHRKVTNSTGFVERVGRKRGNANLYRAANARMLYPPIRREAGDWS